MREFKVGDRVRVVKFIAGDKEKTKSIGKTFTVRSNFGNNGIAYTLEDMDGSFDNEHFLDEELELVNKQTSKQNKGDNKMGKIIKQRPGYAETKELLKNVDKFTSDNREEVVVVLDKHINDIEAADEVKAIIRHLTIMELEYTNNKVGTVMIVDKLTTKQSVEFRSMLSEGISTKSDIVYGFNTSDILSIHYPKESRTEILINPIPGLTKYDLEDGKLVQEEITKAYAIRKIESERISNNFSDSKCLTNYYDSIGKQNNGNVVKTSFFNQ